MVMLEFKNGFSAVHRKPRLLHTASDYPSSYTGRKSSKEGIDTLLKKKNVKEHPFQQAQFLSSNHRLVNPRLLLSNQWKMLAVKALLFHLQGV
jgi:hypothetical protein